ncbi:MAG: hypothetical protein ABIH52_03380 [Candidatus Aenigmatarchaeota archaeon]
MTLTRVFATDVEGSVTVMEHNGCKASLMRAQMLVDTGAVHGLPHGEAIPVFHIDQLPGCPENWARDLVFTYVLWQLTGDCGSTGPGMPITLQLFLQSRVVRL